MRLACRVTASRPTISTSGRELAALRNGDRSVGAVAAFIGTVRDVNADASVSSMTLEHYPGMTEKALAAIVDDAKARWDIVDALVIHRVGALKPADQIVLVGGHERASRRGVRRLRVHHRLPQDSRAVLEEGRDRRRRALGRGARERRRRRGALARRRPKPAAEPDPFEERRAARVADVCA